MWKQYPNDKPSLSKYYCTIHYVKEKNAFFEKALWFDVSLGKWELRWENKEPLVVAWVEESANDFFVDCTFWGDTNITKAVPEEFLRKDELQK